MLTELEVAERVRRRTERHLNEARLPTDKTLDKGGKILLFGPPGSDKSHISAALGRALVENGYCVLFTRTTDIVQRLQAARQELALEAAIAKLERYDLLILDDLSYARRNCSQSSPCCW